MPSCAPSDHHSGAFHARTVAVKPCHRWNQGTERPGPQVHHTPAVHPRPVSGATGMCSAICSPAQSSRAPGMPIIISRSRARHTMALCASAGARSASPGHTVQPLDPSAPGSWPVGLGCTRPGRNPVVDSVKQVGVSRGVPPLSLIVFRPLAAPHRTCAASSQPRAYAGLMLAAQQVL